MKSYVSISTLLSSNLRSAIQTELPPLETQLKRAIQHLEVVNSYFAKKNAEKLLELIPQTRKLFVDTLQSLNFYNPNRNHAVLVGQFYYLSAQFYFHFLTEKHYAKPKVMDHAFALEYPTCKNFLMESLNLADQLSDTSDLHELSQQANELITLLDKKYSQYKNSVASQNIPQGDAKDGSILLKPGTKEKAQELQKAAKEQVKKFRELKKAKLLAQGKLSDAEISQALDKEEKEYLQRISEFPDASPVDPFFESDERHSMYAKGKQNMFTKASFQQFLKTNFGEKIAPPILEKASEAKAPSSAKKRKRDDFEEKAEVPKKDEPLPMDISDDSVNEFDLFRPVSKRKVLNRMKTYECTTPTDLFKKIVDELVNVKRKPDSKQIHIFKKFLESKTRIEKFNLNSASDHPLVSVAQTAETDEELADLKWRRLFEYGLTPLMYAGIFCQSSEFVSALVNTGATLDEPKVCITGNYPLKGLNAVEIAAYSGNREFFLGIQDKNYDLNQVVTKGRWHGFTCLMLACAGDPDHARNELVKSFIQRGVKTDTRIQEPGFAFDQWSAFEFAIANENVEVVKTFLANGVDTTRKLQDKFVWEIALSYTTGRTKKTLEKLLSPAPADGKDEKSTSLKETGEKAAKRAKVESTLSNNPSRLFNNSSSSSSSSSSVGLGLTPYASS